MLRSLVLALDHDASWNMSKPNCRIGFIDVLATRAAGSECIDTQIGLINLDLFDTFHLWHDRNGARRSMYSTLRFRLWDTLDAMRARLKL